MEYKSSITNDNFYKCSNCGFYNSQQKYCMLKQHMADPIDYCSKHKTEVPICDKCNRLLTQPIIWNPEGDKIHIYCRQCFNSLF